MNVTTNSTEQPLGAFASHAVDLFDRELAPIPTGGDNGKRPMIKGYTKRSLAPDTLYAMADDPRYHDSNIAVVCGQSNLNVVDVDDPELLKPMLKRFGKTPIIGQTAGRGGFHLFYKAVRGVGPQDFRISEAIEVEIKAEGNILMFPPSVHPKTRREWKFVEGNLSDLNKLPKFKIEAAVPRINNKSERERIEKGFRNEWLFKQCLREASYCDDFDGLIDVARTRADELMTVCLTDNEIVSCAKSAWKYQTEGKNWVEKEARYIATRSEWREFMEFSGKGSDVFALYTLLVIEHAARVGRGETFRLVTRSMEKAQTIPHWTAKRYTAAINNLLMMKLLLITHKGGGRGNPTQYKLAPTPTLSFGPALFRRDQNPLGPPSQ